MLRRVNVETIGKAPVPDVPCRRDVSELLPLCRENSAFARKKDRLSANNCAKSPRCDVTFSFEARKRMSLCGNGNRIYLSSCT